MNDHTNTLINVFNFPVQFIKNSSKNFSLKIKNQYHALSFLISPLNYIDTNPTQMTILILSIALFFSNLILNLLFLLLLIDCILLSLFILQNISLKIHSVRLSIDILFLLVLYLNPISSVMTIIVSLILYTKYNEITSKFIFNVIQTILLFLFKNIPLFKSVYPDYKPTLITSEQI